MQNIEIINYDDDIYPLRLKEILNPPKKLYTKGNLDLLNETNIAIVGARYCSEYGIRNARKFAKQISDLGINIISGMAMGIDSIAHTSCIENLGNTIAVLPSGFNNIYPKSNLKLYNQILSSNGLVITEYPSKVTASSDKFIERNRIIAGLSLCVIVVEASHRSGTSITAHLAIEQGKKVFCIPGNLESKYSVGTNTLIQEGANLLMCIDDIISRYPFLKERRTKKKTITIPENYKVLYENITDIAISIDELKQKIPMEISDLNFQLTMLEMDGYIIQLPEGRYIRNE